MSVSSTRPSIADLVFHLYGRSVHPELFQVCSEFEICQRRYAAVLRICDGGHTIELRQGGKTVTEVMSGARQPLPERKRLLEKRVHGCRNQAHEFEDLRYQASYQLEQLDPEVFLNYHEELLSDCARASVYHRFAPGHRLAPGSISLIRAEAEPRSLLVHTFHTFPESCGVVKTQSLFEF
jgi:hypothetical protein